MTNENMNGFKKFPTAAPEELGIDSSSLTRFLQKLEDCHLPMHSVIVMRHGQVVLETYYKPYDKDTLHRMFSITKSFVSLGIGLLEEEGKLSLDDKIISFFEDKLPPEGVHPYIASMTIKDMLRMASAHSMTTYKVLLIDDWVKTFFTVPPSHIPGTCFSYDTSSTHTLGALVERLSGMPLLDYLKLKFLNALDFSKNSYCLKDPVGVSIAGSGLMALPYDLLKVMYVIAHEGMYAGKQLFPAGYLKKAVSKQIDTYAKMPVYEEMQGYGYQFWKTTHNGTAMYGMGGQLAVYIPDKDVIFVTTADTQGRQGGVQLIYDTFWNEVYEKIQDRPLPPNDNAAKEMKDFSGSREIMHLTGEYTSPVLSSVSGKTYMLDDNSMNFKTVSLVLNKDGGEFHYENANGKHVLQFGTGKNVIQQFPHYNYKTAVSGIWSSDDTFLIKAHIIDECVGNIFIQLTFKENTVTLMMKKIEETMFNEFEGFASGIMI